jgi:chaperone modulatory protein CbpM
MLLSLEEVVAEAQVSRSELTAWIEQRWVMPAQDRDGFLFDEADRARILFIRDLRLDLDVGDETIPVILKLVDQVYGLRRTLGELQDAIEQLPAEARALLDTNLRKASRSS